MTQSIFLQSCWECRTQWLQRSRPVVLKWLSDNTNHFDDLSEVVDISPSRQCRKRVRQPSNDARLVTKRARHSGGGKIPAKACKHDAENGDFCQVEKLSDDDIIFNYTKLYSVADKAVQDQKILTLMKITSPQRLHTNGWLICKNCF